MRVILGIGNPGSRYQFNRHNVGFLQLDYLAGKHSLEFAPGKGDYYYAEGRISDSAFLLVKPTTYVNKSGRAAEQVLLSFGAEAEDLLVVVDDINLDTAQYRLRASGGDGGHNGMRSIIYHLATDKFPRLRLGVGGDFPKGQMADYVLSDFTETELKLFTDTFNKTAVLLEEFILGGVKRMLDANSKL